MTIEQIEQIAARNSMSLARFRQCLTAYAEYPMMFGGPLAEDLKRVLEATKI